MLFRSVMAVLRRYDGIFDSLFPKMPSYLRRSAITHALGAVSSYRTRLVQWEEGIRRGELAVDTPVDEMAFYINTQLYGLMVAWCMTDASVVGSDRTDAFCETVMKPALMPYRK